MRDLFAELVGGIVLGFGLTVGYYVASWLFTVINWVILMVFLSN